MLSEIAELIPTIKPVKRPFHSVPIIDCGEALVDLLKTGLFAYEDPHPYKAAGAPYGDASPFMLREGVAARLMATADSLKKERPEWRIKIYDGYRPLPVQAHMVAHTFCELARAEGLEPLKTSEAQRDALFKKVYRIWSPPNQNPLTPPPHSTGAAVDVTLVDEHGADLDMGSPIDLNDPVSNPYYFIDKHPAINNNRALLCHVMEAQGFLRHPEEWWHFSYGDQLWVWLKGENAPHKHAAYGRVM